MLPAFYRETLGKSSNLVFTFEQKICFFFHELFPSFADFVQIPYSESLINSLMFADFILFSFYQSFRNFLDCLSNLRVQVNNVGGKFIINWSVRLI